MALTSQRNNFIQNLIDLSDQLLKDEQQIDLLVAEWNLNGYSSMINSDIQVNYPALTITLITNAITAIEAVQTALGDKVSGQQTNLIKILQS